MLTIFKSITETRKKKLGVKMVFGDAGSTLKMFTWTLNYVSTSITSSLLIFNHQTWSNDSSVRDLSCGGVNLSIG